MASSVVSTTASPVAGALAESSPPVNSMRDQIVPTREQNMSNYYELVDQGNEVTIVPNVSIRPRPSSATLPASTASAIAAAAAATPASPSNQKLRHSFYAKCGFRSLEEKRSSLESMLSDVSHLDLNKLAQHVSRNPISASQRERVWKLLLEITPNSSSECRDYVAQVQRAICEDLLRALKLLQLIKTNQLEDPEILNPRVIVLMYLLETGELPPSNQLNTYPSSPLMIANSILSPSATPIAFESVSYLLSVAKRLIEIFTASSSNNNSAPDLMSLYFIFKNFVNNMRKNRHNLLLLAEKLLSCLETDDSELYEKITAPELHGRQLIITWFLKCFNLPLFNGELLIKTWDRIIAGNHKILIHIAKQVLNLRRSLIIAASAKEQLKSLLHDTPLAKDELERFSSSIDL